MNFFFCALFVRTSRAHAVNTLKSPSHNYDGLLGAGGSVRNVGKFGSPFSGDTSAARSVAVRSVGPARAFDVYNDVYLTYIITVIHIRNFGFCWRSVAARGRGGANPLASHLSHTHALGLGAPGSLGSLQSTSSSHPSSSTSGSVL